MHQLCFLYMLNYPAVAVRKREGAAAHMQGTVLPYFNGADSYTNCSFIFAFNSLKGCEKPYSYKHNC